jgi:RecA-family ATPase
LGYDYVLNFNDKLYYTKQNNIYKRKTYVRSIINKKLYDLSQLNKEKIIKESNKIFVQLNKINHNNRKSFFSYSYMFRYILTKLELYD